MKIFELEVKRLNHACIKIKNSKIIYFDPYKISPDESADLILITHEHYDHCSPEDIQKVLDKKTVIIASERCVEELKKLKERAKEIFYLKPEKKLKIDGVTVETVPSYNLNKPFHPKADERLGYIVTLDNKRIYHAGDTDFIPEMKNLKDIDIAFLPVSGTYVMNAVEAARAAEIIKPKVAIPIHYGDIVGTKKDAERFKNLCKINVEILD